MRLRNLLLWDMKTQAKCGFYLLYGILTVLYIIILFALPQAWRGNVTILLIFSDPAAMGLFFMGAIVLLEKSQHIPSALAVSPISSVEYVLAKVTSLCIISLIVATALFLFSPTENYILSMLGTALASNLFTLSGILAATKINSLNQFIIVTVPIEIVGFIPAILYRIGFGTDILKFYPSGVCIDLIAGNNPSIIGLCILFALIILLFFTSVNSIKKSYTM